ncbi:hypothetical protein HSR121_0845 [Halapricum desulfuricans]|uniref:Uncharacterized protein n=1 Tax=Halapricum desulfuricans TaxID=2841257 RepID=A0A897MXM1_9EURY|nr:hypothetical protein HSR121_0845 [Halapricum desulfuricans]
MPFSSAQISSQSFVDAVVSLSLGELCRQKRPDGVLRERGECRARRT